jgi:NADPH-dependent ferric siderophore reductase
VSKPTKSLQSYDSRLFCFQETPKYLLFRILHRYSTICPLNAAIAYQNPRKTRDTFAVQSQAMSNILIQSLGRLLETFLSPAVVLSNQKWEDSSIYEIRIKLPEINFEAWKTIKRLKIQVGPLEYRDYTPSLWDIDNKTCALFIDAGHTGIGSEWATNLCQGDQILLSDAHAANLPGNIGEVLGLGDVSALGHFLALKQLTDQAIYPIQVGIFTNSNDQLPLYFQTVHREFCFVPGNGVPANTVLQTWAMTLDLKRFSSIYIAGNNTLVKLLRTQLRTIVNRDVKIYGHGFWS